MRRPYIVIAAAADDPPDHQTERDRRGNDGASEQQQRRVENRFGLHPHFHIEWLALQSIRQRLLPPQDVSALGLTRWRVVVRDLAGDVHLEDDLLAAPPADAVRQLTRRAANPLPIHE